MMESTLTAIDALKAGLETRHLFSIHPEVKAFQNRCFDEFQRRGLPTKAHEEYKYTPFAGIMEKEIDFLKENGSNAPATADIEPYFYKKEGSRIVMVNGVYSEQLSQVSPTLVLETKPNTPVNYLNELTDPFDWLNLAGNSSHLHISSSVQKERNVLFIYHVSDFSNGQIIAQPNIRYSLARNAALEVIEKHVFIGSGTLFFNSFTYAALEENASLNLTKIQAYREPHIVVDNCHATQKRHSRCCINTCSLSGRLIRNNLRISHNDEHCESLMNGLYVLGNRDHVDNHTAVDHKFPNSYSNELYKGIADDRSRTVFNGKIFVRPGAQKTNAFQANNNISLSDNATINTKPQLEIWADDVKCSHGCTIGQLDEEAVFYLRTRGLDEKSAKTMMLMAFAKDTLKDIPSEEVRNEITKMISDRLQK